MRGTLDTAGPPVSLTTGLPGLLQDDDFVMRFSSAFDTVLAPVLHVLDNLPAYLDPGTAPDDFLVWLASWFDAVVDRQAPLDAQREMVRVAQRDTAMRGTVRGLRRQVALYAGVEPEIVEGGGVFWSTSPGVELPDEAPQRVLVRIRVTDPASFDREGLFRVVRSSTPAHLAVEVEVAGIEPDASAAPDLAEAPPPSVAPVTPAVDDDPLESPTQGHAILDLDAAPPPPPTPGTLPPPPDDAAEPPPPPPDGPPAG